MSGELKGDRDNHLEAAGVALAYIDKCLAGRNNLSIDVVGLSVRGPRAEGDEVFVTVRGLDAEGTPCVAFHSAFSLGEAMRGVAARLKNGTLKWRVDQFKVK
jgi:hypothetical protein